MIVIIIKVEWKIKGLMSKTKMSDVNEQSLYLKDVVVEDTGNITCVAENLAGRAYQHLHLIVYGYHHIILKVKYEM